MAGLLKLEVGDSRGFARLNRALITLIPKKQNVSEVGDFEPLVLFTTLPNCSQRSWLISSDRDWQN
jgi:hypothetical protein